MKQAVSIAALAGAAAVVAAVYILPAGKPQPQSPGLADLLDPRKLALSMCGQDGQRHGLFFRPDFEISLMPSAQAAEAGGPPLWSNLGDYSYTITTDEPLAQAYFDQGLRLTYGFNHWEAIRSFQEAQKIDPGCALCYWAEAYARGPNINAPMAEDAVAPAFAAAAKAQALIPGASDKEQALIQALAKRYSPDPAADRAALDAAYADAMAAVYARYPDDSDIATLYAESVMDLSPWDYWERDFRTPKGEIGKAIAAIEAVLEMDPDHPGAMHLYIHLMEASRMPERAEPYADRLGGLLPGAGHLVHMPSHIYFRVGRYLDSLEANIDAVAADEAYLAESQASDIYRYGYYPHNVHFVLVSAQMAGDGDTALAFAEKLDALVPQDMVDTATWVAPIKAAPYFAYAQFADSGAVLDLPDPGDNAYLKAVWHYIRGVALARSGDAEAAMAAADAIAALNRDDVVTVYSDGGVPAADVFGIAELLVRARVLQAAGELDRAVPLLERAAEIQQGIIYSEPPFWYYPVRQTLGALYLQSGETQKAADAFLASLLQQPNNAWSLYGLLKAQEAMGDPAAEVTANLLQKAAIKVEDIPLDRL